MKPFIIKENDNGEHEAVFIGKKSVFKKMKDVLFCLAQSMECALDGSEEAANFSRALIDAALQATEKDD